MQPECALFRCDVIFRHIFAGPFVFLCHPPGFLHSFHPSNVVFLFRFVSWALLYFGIKNYSWYTKKWKCGNWNLFRSPLQAWRPWTAASFAYASDYQSWFPTYLQRSLKGHKNDDVLNRPTFWTLSYYIIIVNYFVAKIKYLMNIEQSLAVAHLWHNQKKKILPPSQAILSNLSVAYTM